MSKSIHSESGTRFSQARPLLQLFGGITGCSQEGERQKRAQQDA